MRGMLIDALSWLINKVTFCYKGNEKNLYHHKRGRVRKAIKREKKTKHRGYGNLAVNLDHNYVSTIKSSTLFLMASSTFFDS